MIAGPDVLAGIVTHNRATILPKALASVLAQNYPDLHVAVVDDGSADSTPELAPKYSGVLWTRWNDARGYLAARNHFMETADVSYFVSLDDDAWFLDGDEIGMAVDYLEQNPSAAAVAFDILSPDRPERVARGVPVPVAMFNGCGHVLRLSTVRKVGGYAPVPGNYGGEEKDLSLRLLDASYGIVKLPGVHVWHDKTPVAREILAQHRSGVCNDLAMTLRRTPAGLVLAALVAKFYRHSMFAWKHGLMQPCFQGYGLFARSIPAIVRSRQPVRASTLRTFIRLSRT